MSNEIWLMHPLPCLGWGEDNECVIALFPRCWALTHAVITDQQRCHFFFTDLHWLQVRGQTGKNCNYRYIVSTNTPCRGCWHVDWELNEQDTNKWMSKVMDRTHWIALLCLCDKNCFEGNILGLQIISQSLGTCNMQTSFISLEEFLLIAYHNVTSAFGPPKLCS